MDKNVPFTLNVSQYRRKKILDAIMEASKEKKDKGQKIMQVNLNASYYFGLT